MSILRFSKSANEKLPFNACKTSDHSPYTYGMDAPCSLLGVFVILPLTSGRCGGFFWPQGYSALYLGIVRRRHVGDGLAQQHEEGPVIIDSDSALDFRYLMILSALAERPEAAGANAGITVPGLIFEGAMIHCLRSRSFSLVNSPTCLKSGAFLPPSPSIAWQLMQ